MNEHTIAVVATLDTKGEEAGFIRSVLCSLGVRVLLLDCGILGKPACAPDVSRHQLAHWGGSSLEALQGAGENRADALSVMGRGAGIWLKQASAEGRIHGVIGLGGSSGMGIVMQAMEDLPIGFPKIVLGTHFYPQYLGGESDIVLMRSPADILGLNAVMRTTLAQIAGIAYGMLAAEDTLPPLPARPLVGMTCLGVTTPGVIALKAILERNGVDSLVFHANSANLDRLCAAGKFDGVIDFSPNEWLRILVLGEYPERRCRLDAACAAGLPIVMVPGSLDMMYLRCAAEDLPEKYRHRTIFRHARYITGVKPDRGELLRIADVMAQKANAARGPVAVIVPAAGFSMRDVPGSPTWSPADNRAFIDALRDALAPQVAFVELDQHILDPAFAEAVARQFLKLCKAR